MPTLAEYIAQYIYRLLEQSERDYVDVRRSDLALKFNCAPSQVTYVLSTRFGPHSGFVVESRRGGGGYVRIIKLPVEDEFVRRLYHVVGDAIGHREALQIIGRLSEESLITGREAGMMAAIVGDGLSKVELPGRNTLRAQLMRAMLAALLRGME
ncbi:CtsR family transcriptional regulator [Desulforudis sp. 1088]|uniref:CtsR family transcriptional regulator n=1 Tax=unclassified Candidatus Desulforudis TaxID=2635950 RepID=UPI003487E92C